ncbi:MAG: molybdopterin-dependent oxidoreductase [Candidatus Bathyarchaeia archaeon]
MAISEVGKMMKQSRVLLVTVTIIGILLVASFGWSFRPTVHAESNNGDWQLSVSGLVDTPLNLTLAGLEAMPQTTVYADLICVGSPGVVLEEGNWTGVQLWTLLETAGVSLSAIKVTFLATDGFKTDLSIATAQRSDVVLAYEENGNPLPDELRMVVPGEWGYKWIDMVTVIQLVNYNFLGTEESMGYDDNGVSAQIPNIPPSHSDSSTLTPLLSPSPTPQFSAAPSSSGLPSSTGSPSSTDSPSATLATPTRLSKQTSLTTNYTFVAIVAALIATATAALIFRKSTQIKNKKQVHSTSPVSNFSLFR